MVWRYKNRWFRRWLVLIIFWAVPVMIVAANELREQLAYDAQDLAHSLSSWTFTDAQRASPAISRCYGSLDEARSAGCPPDVIAANVAKNQDARVFDSPQRAVRLPMARIYRLLGCAGRRVVSAGRSNWRDSTFPPSPCHKKRQNQASQ